MTRHGQNQYKLKEGKLRSGQRDGKDKEKRKKKRKRKREREKERESKKERERERERIGHANYKKMFAS